MVDVRPPTKASLDVFPEHRPPCPGHTLSSRGVVAEQPETFSGMEGVSIKTPRYNEDKRMGEEEKRGSRAKIGENCRFEKRKLYK